MLKNLPPVSNSYKNEVRNAVISIVFFFLIYAVLILISLGLIAFLGYLAFLLITAKVGFLTILIGAGLVGMGIFILIFLLKFMFSHKEYDHTGTYEISRTAEPALFKLIDEVVEEVQTQHPKKVFLSSDVNAYVNYDSAFWSMFFPVKKNLTVGMGLINTTTVSELKGILAHEFGHFSQRSMKVGSFVGQAHRIIYDLLFNDSSFQNMLSRFAEFHAILYFFARLAQSFTAGIRWILVKIYDLVLLKHSSLSRQMEFDADAIATSIVGSEVKADALLRLDISEKALTSAIAFYNYESVDFDTKNIYENQRALLKYFGEANSHKIKNELPYVRLSEIERYHKSKLKIEDQWASHPTIQQRIEAIDKLGIVAVHTEYNPAKSIIEKFEYYAEQFTNLVLADNNISRSKNYIGNQDFIREFAKIDAENSFSKIFNSYYDFKSPVLLNYKEIVANNSLINESEDLFSDERVALVLEKQALDSDYEAIDMIGNGTYALKSFDYDGIKYAKAQTMRPKNIISERLKVIGEQIKENDIKIFESLYLKSDVDQKKRLYELQETFNEADAKYDEFFTAFHEFIPYLSFMSETLQSDQIINLRKKLLNKEKDFKSIIRQLPDSVYSKFLSGEQRVLLSSYVNATYYYFNLDHYVDEEIQMLNDVLDIFQKTLNSGYFRMKKEYLDFQAAILSPN